MEIHVDLSQVPPSIELREPEDFKRFSVSCASVQDSYVSRAVLEDLAGERAADPDWRRQLEAMLAYAGSKGWLREDGAIQAHVEWRS
jgi:hypothetical protein